MTETDQKAGTVIEGWRKQPLGHWYDSETRTRATLTDEGIEVHCTAGYSGVPVPVDVIRDLLDQDEPCTPP